ncbi:MAG: hypothetical protein NT001_01165 [Candidatus Woesearchaeota archaeon]|nr:hypothetical protein [Candidatus Woesearchaeota archaeon]
MEKTKKLKMMLFFALLFILLFAFANISLADEDNDTNSTNTTVVTSTIDEENSIFAQWVKEGQTFTVGGKQFDVAAGDTTTSVILMGEEGVFVIEKDYCKLIGKLNFCLKSFKYTIGGDVVIHGSDTQEFYIVVFEPGPVLQIQRKIDNNDMMEGDTATVTISIVNSGADPATGMEYTETVPSEFEITNTYDIDQYGNTLKWTGSMPGEYTKSFSYTIKARSRYSGSVTATLTYKVGDAVKQVTSKLGMNAKALWNMNLDADKTELESGEETRLYVLFENNADTEQEINLKIEVPGNLNIEATQFNSTSGNTIFWNGTIPVGEDLKFATAVKVKYPAKTQIKATAAGGIGFPVVKYLNMTVATNDPQIYFIHGDIFSLNKSQLKIYIKNPDTYLSITDLSIKVQSSILSGEGSANEFKPKENNQILAIDFTPEQPGTYPVTAELNYTVGGQTLTISKTENIEVIDKKAVEEKPAEPVPEAPKPKELTAEEKAKISRFEDLKRRMSLFDKIVKTILFWR